MYETSGAVGSTVTLARSDSEATMERVGTVAQPLTSAWGGAAHTGPATQNKKNPPLCAMLCSTFDRKVAGTANESLALRTTELPAVAPAIEACFHACAPLPLCEGRSDSESGSYTFQMCSVLNKSHKDRIKEKRPAYSLNGHVDPHNHSRQRREARESSAHAIAKQQQHRLRQGYLTYRDDLQFYNLNTIH